MSAKKSGSGSEPPLTPAASVDGDISMTLTTSTYDLGHKREREDGKAEGGEISTSVTGEPAKKKRRIALTRVGDLDS
jgi:chromatin assembly factor 1 subunit B